MNGVAVDDKLSYGLGATYGAPRSYAAKVGIPPQILIDEVPFQLRLEGMASWKLLPRAPLSVFVRALAALPPLVF